MILYLGRAIERRTAFSLGGKRLALAVKTKALARSHSAMPSRPIHISTFLPRMAMHLPFPASTAALDACRGCRACKRPISSHWRCPVSRLGHVSSASPILPHPNTPNKSWRRCHFHGHSPLAAQAPSTFALWLVTFPDSIFQTSQRRRRDPLVAPHKLAR